jgi:hypothetical protein
MLSPLSVVGLGVTTMAPGVEVGLGVDVGGCSMITVGVGGSGVRVASGVGVDVGVSVGWTFTTEI